MVNYRQHKNTKQMQLGGGGAHRVLTHLLRFFLGVSLPLISKTSLPIKITVVKNPVIGARGLGGHLILTKTKLPPHRIEGELRADVDMCFISLVVLEFWMCLPMSSTSTKQNAEKTE